MAPPPEYDKEPKAPDKTAIVNPAEDTKILHSLVNDQHANSDHKPSNTIAAGEGENKHADDVETLDDGQLRALLDEAITYKNPKDREGKSSLFKELLEEVEQDEQACEEARTLSCFKVARCGGRNSRALPHSNSLQDLVAELAAESAPRKSHARHHQPTHAPSNVSAWAIHGGSLPSGVDTSSLSEEPRAGYLATVRCVNPPPLAERRVSASDANSPGEMESLNKNTKLMYPMTYTARATLEIGSGSVSSGRAVTTTTASNQVDTTISFSCITTPEVVARCNTTSSTSQSALAVDPKPRSVSSSTFNGLPLSRPSYGATATASTTAVAAATPTANATATATAIATATTVAEDYKKSLDENGNSVQGFSSPLSVCSQHKKPRRKKSSKNETVIDCQQIDGYQGDKDVNELLRFIESNADSGRSAKLGRVKHKDDSDDKGGKKRSSERRKDKENKMTRATSLEELSRTTIEELTSDKRRAEPERRSWGDELPRTEPEPTELTDFQTVTKKRKPRRRADEPAPRRKPAPPAHRDSAPPSERSNDSNDDADAGEQTRTTAPPAAPPASYADITRTHQNIPDLIESCNFTPTTEYPALESKPAPCKPAKPDVVSDRRPAVILVESGTRPRDMDGITFGFDINEQLLDGGARKPRVDLVSDAERALAVRAGCAALRYLPPAPAPLTSHLHQIIDYVGHAWEDVVRVGSGKVQYYSE